MAMFGKNSVFSKPLGTSKTAKSITKPVDSFAQGWVKLGEETYKSAVTLDAGRFTDAYATGLFDLFSGGNGDQANELSGGLRDSLSGTYRGNSKDGIRLGVTAAAAYGGGVTGAAAANQFFASQDLTTANALKTGLNYAGDKTGGSLGNILKNVGSTLNPTNFSSGSWKPSVSEIGISESPGISPLILIGGLLLVVIIFIIIKKGK